MNSGTVVLARGLFFEGWEPAKVPLKMSRDEFLAAVREKIVADKFIDPLRITQCVLEVIGGYVAPGEIDNAGDRGAYHAGPLLSTERRER